jgi:glycosyltransferase involved in cell wall biosynthesis
MSSLLALLFIYGRQHLFSYPSSKPVPVSIVVPCYNAGSRIGKVLESLLHLDYPQNMIEIIVVDDKSTDNSAEVVSSYALRYPCIHLIKNKRNSGAAAEPTNIGIRHASHDYIAVTDDDSTPCPDALKKMLGFLQKDSRVAAVTCAVLAKPGSSFIQQLQAIEYYIIALNRKLLYSSGSGIQIKRLKGNNNNVFENNFIVNITNLKQTYSQNEFVRLRVFVQDFNTELKYYKLPVDLTSNIYSNMFWRLINSNTKEIVIPFETNYNSTKLSSDGLGMYFDLYMQDLPTNQIYEIEFLIKENNKDYYITNNGFKFKVLI